jgi:hypothetical protein
VKRLVCDVEHYYHFFTHVVPPLFEYLLYEDFDPLSNIFWGYSARKRTRIPGGDAGLKKSRIIFAKLYQNFRKFTALCRRLPRFALFCPKVQKRLDNPAGVAYNRRDRQKSRRRTTTLALKALFLLKSMT